MLKENSRYFTVPVSRVYPFDSEHTGYTRQFENHFEKLCGATLVGSFEGDWYGAKPLCPASAQPVRSLSSCNE